MKSKLAAQEQQLNSFKETKTEKITSSTTKRTSEARGSKPRPERSGLNSTTNKSAGPNHQGSTTNLRKDTNAKEAQEKRRLEK